MKWVYKLSEEGNPLIRLGIHGLWRLLHHGEKDEHFPAIQQKDGVSWVLGEDSIELTFPSEAHLIPIMRGMLGDFRDAKARLPGYDDNYGALISACAHTGTSMMSAPKAQRRSKVLDAKKSEVKAWAEHTGRSIRLQKDKIEVTRGAEGEEVSLRISPQAPVTGDFPPGIEAKAKPLSLSPKFGSEHHPYFSAWYNKEAKAEPIDSFVVLFAVLAHAWTQNGYFALGIDAPTFVLADKVHRVHMREPLLRLGGGAHFQAWALATHLGLPDTTQVVLTIKPTEAFMHRPGGFNPLTRQQLHAVASASIVPYTRVEKKVQITNKQVKAMHFVPVEEHGEKVVTLQDVLLENFSVGRHWSSGLNRMFGLRIGDRKEQILKLWEKRTLEEIVKIVESKMDKLWRVAIGAQKYNIERAYSQKGYNGERAREKAHQFVVDIVLPRVVNEGTLLQALADLAREGGSGIGATTEMLNYLRSWVKKDPGGVQGFLLVAALMPYNKQTAAAERIEYFEYMGWTEAAEKQREKLAKIQASTLRAEDEDEGEAEAEVEA